MSISWKDVGKSIAGVAPVIGSILSGPAGVAVTAAGALLGKALGVEPTPDNVAKALAADPATAAKIAEIESNERIQLATLASQQAIAQTNADRDRDVEQQHTFQAEVNQSDLYTKRTRPKIARQSWYAAMAYLGAHLLSSVAHAVVGTVTVVSFDAAVFLAVASPAMAYTGARSFDLWRSGGAKKV